MRMVKVIGINTFSDLAFREVLRVWALPFLRRSHAPVVDTLLKDGKKIEHGRAWASANNNKRCYTGGNAAFFHMEKREPEH